jgi:hypothetical protein
MFVHEENILDIVLQVHKMVKSGSEPSEPTLGIQKEIYPLQGADKLMVYHMIQDFTNTTSQTDTSVTSYVEVILT